jgi:Domain of unknown function (DUF5606)
MGLKGIISISGMPGLYKVLAQSKSGFIVEGLHDRKRLPVSSTQRISMLEDISVFTTTDDLPLKDVMNRLKEFAESGTIVDPKTDPAKLKDFFKKVIPEFDEERVYPSDIKKIINWYGLVKDVLDIEDEPAETPAAESTPEESAPEVPEAAPVKKTRKKKNDAAGE